MLVGSIVLLSGNQIYRHGFEGADYLPSLISVAMAISKELGGKPRAMDYENIVIYIVPSNRNPDVLMVFGARERDFAVELFIRRLAQLVDSTIPERTEDPAEIGRRIKSVMDRFFKVSSEAPSFSEISAIAREVIEGLPEDLRDGISMFAERARRMEMAEEAARFLKPEPREGATVDSCARQFYLWKLHDAFEEALALAESGRDPIHRLLAAKIGALLLQLPPPYPIPAKGLVEELADVSTELPSAVEEFVKWQVRAIVSDDREGLRRFIRERHAELIRELRSVPEEMEDVYAILYFIQSRTVFRTPLGDEILAFLARKSELLYRIMMNERNTAILFDRIYRPSRWRDVAADVNTFRLKFLGMMRRLKLPEVSPKGWADAELIRDVIEAMMAFREYLLAVLVAFEAFGAPINERESLLKEAVFEVMPLGMKVVHLNPPMLFRVFYDIYSASLYVLYYMTMVKGAEEGRELWREIWTRAMDGLRLFTSYEVRGRIGSFHYVVMASTAAFFVCKYSIRYGGFPPEILFFVDALAKLREEDIRQLDSLKGAEKLQLLSQVILCLGSLAKAMRPEAGYRVADSVAELAHRTMEWGIKNAMLSWELIDNLIDIAAVLTELASDPEVPKRYVRSVKSYAEIFSYGEEGDAFESAIINSGLAVLCRRFLKKFSDEEVRAIFSEAKEAAISLWEAMGKDERAGEIRRLSS